MLFWHCFRIRDLIKFLHNFIGYSARLVFLLVTLYLWPRHCLPWLPEQTKKIFSSSVVTKIWTTYCTHRLIPNKCLGAVPAGLTTSYEFLIKTASIQAHSNSLSWHVSILVSSGEKIYFTENSLKFHLFVTTCSFSFILVLTGLFNFVLRVPKFFLNTTKRLKLCKGNKLYTHIRCLCSCHWPSQVMMINTKNPCLLPYDKIDFPSGISLQQFLFPCVHIISDCIFSF